MKTVIAGSRTITQYGLVEAAIQESGFEITEVVSGGSRGVDRSGELWAQIHGVPVRRFPADWVKLGRRAGAVRNYDMAKYADALIVVWDGTSRGSKIMKQFAEDEHLKIFERVVGSGSE
jgi:hypothetical protein